MDDKDQVRGRARDAADDVEHSAAADKARGHTKETIGKVKEKVGSFIGDDKLQAKGDAQRLDGKKDRLKGEIKEKIEDTKDKIRAGAEVVKDKFDEARGRK